ncbi:fumarylacetoacetate (FAA) hydrolase family protein [Dongia mobilis]|uniref:Fumarylacetoacetate (FAA) hydrolase family protein n=1 Tax=Dongia mobilis TaxID=578943 RepID=A0A4R6WND9_9PROT|nr:fumarylacetoacetate hydrolase family protein [Dongia mobilis]TDQ80470.1 fumarylacetoacetate (FAA) hydrolase family protein [Dongia mobilis]
MHITLTAQSVLPDDGLAGTLLGRVWVPGRPGGPCVVLATDAGLKDLTPAYATMSALLAEENPVTAAREAAAKAPVIGSLADVLANTPPDSRDETKPYLLSPIDLQAIKACGVTFAVSMLERVIEERAKGDPQAAEGIRQVIDREIGGDLRRIKPGSAEADRLKQALIERGMWSQYLEVGIGPYAEVFTKSQPMSSVGAGADIGIHPESSWNNPEPEIVLVVDPRGRIVGATLGNDVNLRDFEGRSALLLGRAKDNNASAALGPFIRLVDETYDLDDIRAADLRVKVEGLDQFVLDDKSSMSLISRDIADLAGQTLSKNHQYPDGLVLYVGTMFAPIKDRDTPGGGFTHKVDDIVTISTPKLGALVNRVRHCPDVAPWTFGTGALMRNLAARGLLAQK